MTIEKTKMPPDYYFPLLVAPKSWRGQFASMYRFQRITERRGMLRSIMRAVAWARNSAASEKRKRKFIDQIMAKKGDSL